MGKTKDLKKNSKSQHYNSVTYTEADYSTYGEGLLISQAAHFKQQQTFIGCMRLNLQSTPAITRTSR